MLSSTTPLTDSVVTSLNEFGLRLFRQLCATDGGLTENVVMSPFSIAAALAMVFDGATGGTRDEMASVLGLDSLTQDEVNAAYAGLIAALTSPDQDTLLEIANSLWTNKGIPVKPEYLERNRVNFQAAIAEIAFDAAGIQTINDWVSDRTHGKIPSIIDALNPLSAMVLLNAVYFKAKWLDPFDTRVTRDQPFTLKNGKEKLCRMMSRLSSLYVPYFEDEQIKVVRLPYQGPLPYQGGRTSMVVILPNRDSGLDGFLSRLTADKWNGWLDRLSEPNHHINLLLPRFKSEFDAKLNDALIALGMGVAFDSSRAEFEDIGPKGQWFVGDVQHKTFIDVTEEGTEAAAVTKVEMFFRGKESLPEPISMVVDRPFFFAIVDDRTRAISFAGAIVDPGDAGTGVEMHQKSLNVRYNDRLVYSERVKSDDAE